MGIMFELIVYNWHVSTNKILITAQMHVRGKHTRTYTHAYMYARTHARTHALTIHTNNRLVFDVHAVILFICI